MKCFVNAGHSPKIMANGLMEDCGAVNNTFGITEAEIVRDISIKVCKYLNQAGVNTDIIQQDNLDRGYDSIVSIINRSNCDITISIHCDACTHHNARGTTTYVYDEYCTESILLADCIQKQLVDTLQSYDRGTRCGNLAFVRETHCPAVLVEVLYIDNDDDARLLVNDNIREDIARAIARGITDYGKIKL